jgi:hypothetical protein
MHAIKMSPMLNEVALLLEEAGCSGPAAELRDIGRAIATGGNEAVSKTVAKVQKHWKSCGRIAAYPSSLKTQLERIALVLKASDATKPAKAVSKVLELFTGDADASAAAFISDLMVGIQAPAAIPKPKLVKQRSKVRRSALNANDVRAIADRLTAASSNNMQFDAEVAGLEANSQLKTAELASIAKQYLGSERAFKKKSEIFAAMKSRQAQDAVQASRDRRSDKIAV